MQQGTVLEKGRCKYLGIVINKKGNLKIHIKEMGQKSNKILLEINATGAKSQVRTGEIRN